MRVEDFFALGESLHKQCVSDPSLEEIYLRTAINRLYYGLFHFLQRRLGIAIPFDQKDRCHRFVKEAIEKYSFRNDYSQIEELRVRSDYEMSDSLRYPEYKIAERLKNRIIGEVDGVGEIPYDAADDEEFFDRVKKKDI